MYILKQSCSANYTGKNISKISWLSKGKQKVDGSLR